MEKYSFKFDSSKPRSFADGDFFRASFKNFPVLKGLAIQGLHLKKGAIREPHVHPNANQLDYCLEGKAKVGIVGPDGFRQMLDLEKGDISFVPQGYLHWIENTGNTPLRFLVVLSHEEPETVELSDMLSGIPSKTFGSMFNIDPKIVDKHFKESVLIGKADRFNKM